ncbi:exopolysaccharide biosynthesis polyprenyl glycosylphosphotransferase [Flavobacterium branchiophilum]|uniref:Putative colanic biosynthesis UDP-glucose lipid carrier transferase n=3 Tax=Flavobacterium branchiophilum TaxID=55197 RepID=G2Z3E2_FLABF|nr:exopolysaccharide biosynthesis polyprenyl glycosylphosphotransferase [Flavobacterium branchiophilum]PDS26987.1 undecaprenyl-phosphate glucose phosphotransferase [Flavobacterium branchiophilum]TQM40541.1 putative colanic acid biosynthesis UDP-glucose lipid carrier transferase [Flavobacterium branchiophilum]GEM55070.1 undecaprenyl-phosphate glucose phosphotransferase [Flavobacterium branchiophilum NBRC 15030 = ATCC 35035]CCB68255.1 Putative colanic biosynthesis UDP-glucose lipid carrier transf
MKKRIGRYSAYIRPFTYLVDLLVINLLADYWVFSKFGYFAFVSIAWFVTSWNTKFYEVYRFTKAFDILEKIVKQFIVFLILNFAYLGFLLKIQEASVMIKYISLSIFIISCFKFAIFFALRIFRSFFGGNFRKVIIIGEGQNVWQLSDFFLNNTDFGYKLFKVFTPTADNLFIEKSFQYVKEYNIDEIYCSLPNLSKTQIKHYIDFADNNLKTLKFLPDNKEIISRSINFDYYGYIPVISLRNIPLDSFRNKFIKRVFDIVFSILVIVFVLSWMIPLIGLLIKLESKGPVFFKQQRNGLNYHEFSCLKFRSMRLNPIADLEQVQKNDPRITKIGKFIRKTSIDEMPQFFNVLFGSMSVVGPRPHMVSHTEMYAKSVDKFMVRHFIKPGITGLAQTNGFRGEVENEKDIIYRVRYDIFYLENWNLMLDLKIVILTIINAIRGDKKAY